MISNDKVYPLTFSFKTDNNTVEYKAFDFAKFSDFFSCLIFSFTVIYYLLVLIFNTKYNKLSSLK